MEKKTKIIIAGVLLILLISVFSISSYYFYNNKKVVTTITMDVNPSIEIRLNKYNKVVDIIALNDDGKVILNEKSYRNETYLDAIEDISRSLVAEKYITEENNVVLISVDDENIKKDIKNEVTNAFKEAKIEADVKFQEVNDELRKQAEKYDISLNKASYIEEIVKENSDLKFEELKDKTINEINDLLNDKKIAEEKRLAEEKLNELNDKAYEEAKKAAEATKKAAEEAKQKAAKKVTDNVARKGSLAKCENVKEGFSREQAIEASFALLGLTFSPYLYNYQTIASEYNGICAYETIIVYNKTYYKIYYSYVDGSFVYKSETPWAAGNYDDIVEIIAQYFNGLGVSSENYLIRSASGTVNDKNKHAVVEYNGLKYNFVIDQKTGNIISQSTEPLN